MDTAFFRPSLRSIISTSLMIKVGPRIAGSWDWSRDHLHRRWLAGLHTLEPPCRWWGWHPFEEIEVSRCASLQVAWSRHPLLEVGQGSPVGKAKMFFQHYNCFKILLPYRQLFFTNFEEVSEFRSDFNEATLEEPPYHHHPLLPSHLLS